MITQYKNHHFITLKTVKTYVKSIMDIKFVAIFSTTMIQRCFRYGKHSAINAATQVQWRTRVSSFSRNRLVVVPAPNDFEKPILIFLTVKIKIIKEFHPRRLYVHLLFKTGPLNP